MIKAVIDYRNDFITGFKVTGHADSGPYGQDIVCAAVSALSITTVNGLIKIAQIKPVVEQNESEGGFLQVKLPNNVSDSVKQIKAQTLLLSFQNGLSDISENYAKYLKLIIKH